MKGGMIKAAFGGLVLVAAAGIALVEGRIHRSLRDEWGRAQGRQEEVARLKKLNQVLAAAIERLAALPPPKPAPALPPLRAHPLERQPHVALAAGFLPTAECRNRGLGTARNAFETYLWALDHGDVAALAGVLSLDDSARGKVEALFASLPEASRMKYGSGEQMFATVFAYAHPLSFDGLQIVGETMDQPQADVLATQWQFPRGQIRDHRVSLTLTAEGWKWPVREDDVAAALALITDPR